MSVEILKAPKETVFGKESLFEAVVEPRASGQIHFALKTYAGETV